MAEGEVEEKIEVVKKPYSKEKIGVTVMLVGLTAAIFLAIGYWAGTESASLQDQELPTYEQCQICKEAPPIPSLPDGITPTITTSSATDETASWKTYTNDGYGFSFKYPSSFTVLDNIQSDGNWTIANKVSLSNSDKSLELWINPDGFGPFFPDYLYETTASTSGVNIEGKGAKSTDENSQDGTTLAITQFTYSSTNFLIHYKVSGSDGESLEEFDQILSSFKFTK